MKNIVKGYYKPTPKKWRKIGDALLAASMTVTTFSVYSYPSVAIAAAIVGTVGKFISNLFTEDANGEA